MKKTFFMTLVVLLAASVATLFAMTENPTNEATTKQVPEIEHPIKKPKMYSKATLCPNCGMMINMWARTRHSFQHPEGELTTCSLRCLADKSESSGAEATDTQVAVYLEPEIMIPATEAVYLIGSTASGTMTMQSKIAFADRESAEQFASSYGGKLVSFAEALTVAKAELPESRVLIDKKRKKTGKIKEPTEKDSCTVCGMYPSRFPEHTCQIWTMDGSTLYFCSTQCMVNYNDNPAKYLHDPPKPQMSWVTLFSDGMYESALGAYYVVQSKISGPMGREAIPFKLKKRAEEFIAINGGQIVTFQELTPALVMK